jgi:putative chitinase
MAATISGAQLRALNPKLAPPRADLIALVLGGALGAGGLTSNRRVRHFIAQVMVETGALSALVESTRYSDPVRLDELFKNVQGVEHARRLIAAGPEAIGNTIYANKCGNGGVASGDGYRYRGRGFLQVTGRANYRDIGKIVGMPLELQPDLLGEPEPAAQAAAVFWKQRAINTPADADDVGTVTFLVNGPARLHLDERRAWLQRARAIWPD